MSAALLTSPSCALALGKKPPSLEQPEKALCILGDKESAACICFDPRRPVDQQSYVLSLSECRNFIAMDAIDYNAQQEWVHANCFGPKPKSAQPQTWGEQGSTLGELK